MSKLYTKEIEDCTMCPYVEVFDEFDKDLKFTGLNFYCSQTTTDLKYVSLFKNKNVEEYCPIPEWCPLEDS